MVWEKLVSKGNGTNEQYDLVGIGVGFLEEVCHRGGRPRDLIYAQAMPSETVYFPLPAAEM